eukprot:gnl/MRDRNA2_/MRDRNA2_63335_c0_seq1.p1 gnl/MRDRNA2_/MRDRNA2_63335_c0~~gnl/MRDRNA2_/MRDRNA2_63335_c0_seq1.p1  ORF type:complete len:300 (+),score=74.23 gnl/MRDRNA2_/MRDRNA2_63335_c0_seq1:106-1005(+)
MSTVVVQPKAELSHQKSRAKVDADEDYFLNMYKGTVFKYGEEGQAGQLAPMLFDFLAVIDTANNGELSAEEIDEAADIIRIAKKGKEGNSADLNYKHLPEAVAKVLAGWDADKSGTVGVSELVMAAEAQKKMSEENRLVKKLLVGAVIVIFILMAGTFALSLTAVEMAKETTADQDSGIVTTKSGNVGAMGTAVQRLKLVDFPSLGVEKLKEMRDFGYVLDDAYKYRMLSGFDWYSETKMTLTATNGEVILIDNGVLTLQKPGGEVQALDSEAGRRLNFGGAFATSGSFTMMAMGSSMR